MRIGISLPVRELQNDLAAIREFAQTAEELDFTHLRVPELVIRPNGGHLHEPLTLLSWLAALTLRIELVPSVIILPARQTALVARQAAAIDVLSGGRLRLGKGVGASAEEYAALGQDFHTRGRRCEEQIALLRLLWTQERVDFEGRWDRISGAGIDPLPVQRPISRCGSARAAAQRRPRRCCGASAASPTAGSRSSPTTASPRPASGSPATPRRPAATRHRSGWKARSLWPARLPTSDSRSARPGPRPAPRTSACARSARASTPPAT